MERETKRNRFEIVATLWGNLESQPAEMVVEILLKLPLNDLLVMKQVSKSSFAFIEDYNVIEGWFDRYMGSNKLVSSWILQKMIARNDFQLEHVNENVHVFVIGFMSKDETITLRIEDNEQNMLYRTLMSVQPVINARQRKTTHLDRVYSKHSIWAGLFVQLFV